MNIAVIFAGGAGKRMNTHAKPKQFLEMHGKPILIYTLEHFENHPEIDAIILVCIESWIDYAKKILYAHHIKKVAAVVPGGTTGQTSIFQAITTTPAIETIFVNTDEGEVGKIFNRSCCSMARAPQCFYMKDIYEAHCNAQRERRTDFIDSAMLMQHYGAKLRMVEGPVENIKITTPTDFYLFRALLEAQENMQIVGL